MRVAVCGLGRMGSAFAAALVGDGHEVAVWNRTPARVDGARTAATPGDAAREAQAVVIVVFDGPAAEEVLFGETGVAPGAAPGTLVVNATTLSPDESRALARRAASAGLRYLEAPVLGSVPAVRRGALHVLTGGAQGDAADAEPVLRAWSHAGRRQHVGPVGSASALKLVANLALGTTVAALHDAVRLGRALDLDREDVLDVLQNGVCGPLVTRKRERLSRGAYGDADFTLAALAKDLALAASAADAPLVMAEAAGALIARAAEHDGHLDVAAMGRA